MMSLIPLARTPASEQGVSALRDYTRRLERVISAIAPWVKRSARNRMREVKSGETVVVMDSGDLPANHPLFKGAKIAR
jgi:hypothetical protein